jgi:hypothetical protein
VRLIVRSALVACLISGLLNLSPLAAAAKPLGMVVLAENAHLSGVTANVGSDVFAGDTLHTDPGGSLRLKFGSTQLYLTSDSAATLGQETNPLYIALAHGTLGFSSNAAGQFEIDTPVGAVRAADGQRAFGEVTIVGPRKILVASYHGSLVVAGSGIQRTIPEGNSYNVTFVPSSDSSGANPAGSGADPAAAAPAGPPKPALTSGSLVFDLVMIGAAGGFGYFLWHHFTESDPNPTPSTQ